MLKKTFWLKVLVYAVAAVLVFTTLAPLIGSTSF